jgi:predicted esterase
VVAAAAGVWYARRDHSRVVARRSGSIARVETLAQGTTGDGTAVRDLRLTSDRGLRFVARVREPAPAGAEPAIGARRPAILLLAGLETGKQAVDLVSAPAGTVTMSIDYPFEVPEALTRTHFLLAVPAIRNAVYDACGAGCLALRYLASREDVDPNRIFVVGVSFGAFIAPIVTAGVPVADALVIVQGGGDLRKVLEVNLPYVGVERFSGAISRLGAVLLHPFEPTRWVGRMSPRRFILISSTDDERIPRACVTALYDAAGDPKEMVWLETVHIHPTDDALIEAVAEEVERRLFSE